ncbi:MAG: hypothetical protein KGI38_12600 [Thaumarchaeota archaeon]|nr:hypothetical protein [Nitrososphaerota archaeon]
MKEKLIVGFIRRSHHKNEGWFLFECFDFDGTAFHAPEPHGRVKPSDLRLTAEPKAKPDED